MVKIFISYSRVDRPAAEELVWQLRRVYGNDNVWMDDELTGGDIWWEEILDQVAACDIFLYLLSNDSVNSPYCQAEYREAYRLRKRIITAQIRDQTNLTDELAERQYIDMTDWQRKPDQSNELHRAIQKQAGLVRRTRARQKGRTPKPTVPTAEEEQAASRAAPQSSTLIAPGQPPQPPASIPSDSISEGRLAKLADLTGCQQIWIIAAGTAIAMVVAALFLGYLDGMGQDEDEPTSTPTTPAIVQRSPTTETTPTDTATSTATVDVATPTPAPSVTDHVASDTPIADTPTVPTTPSGNLELMLFVEDESLTLYVPGDGTLVSLEGIAFQVGSVDDPEIYRIDDYRSFDGLDFTNLPTPNCIRLRLDGWTGPWPQECHGVPENNRFPHDLIEGNMFWLDALGGRRLIKILRGTDIVGQCPAGQPRCEIQFSAMPAD